MTDLIHRASRLAGKWHHRQFRKHFPGVPYIVHPARVAGRIAEAVSSEVMVAAAWCHDLLEDTACDEAQLERVAGTEVLALVKELTNPSKQFPELPRAERKAMDRKHAAGMSYRAKIIKTSDRIDNLLDAADCNDDEWVRMYCQESILLGEALGVGPSINISSVANRILSQLPYGHVVKP